MAKLKSPVIQTLRLIASLGEHIDYALFGVIPAAIERDILIACSPRPISISQGTVEPHQSPGAVIAENLQTRYTRQAFAPTPKYQGMEPSEEEVHAEGWHLDINTKELRWESYVKAGYYVSSLIMIVV